MGSCCSREKKRDSTAQGVCKVRIIETRMAKPLFEDPFAEYMFPWSTRFVMRRLSSQYMWSKFTSEIPGMYEMLATRTRWLDDLMLDAVTESNEIRQVLVLAAGYDARAYRIGLPEHVQVFEVDQPAVQRLKRRLLSQAPAALGAVEPHFVGVDFNDPEVSLENGLRENGFDTSVPTMVTIEGVSQYIPKESLKKTLKTLESLCAPGSRLGFSYVDQRAFDEPTAVVGSAYGQNGSGLKLKLLDRVAKIEPWVSGYSPIEIKDLLETNSAFTVVSETTMSELCLQYLPALDRELDPANRLDVERYVSAIKT